MPVDRPTSIRTCPHCGDPLPLSAARCPSRAETVAQGMASPPQSVFGAPPLPVGPVSGEKSGGTAVLLDFLLPGVGHLYGSGGSRGTGLLVASIILGVLSAALFATLPPLVLGTGLFQIVIWIQAMATAGSVVKEYNNRLRAKVMQHAQAAHEAGEVRARQQKAAETEAARQITGQAVADELHKIANLKKMGIINEPEFVSQTDAFFQQLTDRVTTESIGDFFTPIGKLVEEDEISQENVERLKAIYQHFLHP